jgi:hypothetical protein
LKEIEERLELELQDLSPKFHGVFCRFVLQHLTVGAQRELIKRILALTHRAHPIVLTDIDQVPGQFHKDDSELETWCKDLEMKLPMDLTAGKRLGRILRDAGAKSVEFQVEPIVLKGEELQKEAQRMSKRLHQALPHLATALGA